MAARFLKERHLTWTEVLEPPAPAPVGPICPCCCPSPEFGWRRLADLCLQIGHGLDLLNEWATGFLGTLRRCGYPPTATPPRSGESRVGEECRSRGGPY